MVDINEEMLKLNQAMKAKKGSANGLAPSPASTKYKMRYHRLFSLGNYENESIEIEDTFSNNVPDHVALITLKTRVLELQKAGYLGKKVPVNNPIIYPPLDPSVISGFPIHNGQFGEVHGQSNTPVLDSESHPF
jgi:hypothetical protein